MCADSTASGKLNASFRKSSAVIVSNLNGFPIELELPQIKKKRQTERNSDENCTQHRQPKESHPQPPSFTLNEREEHDCRDDHVQSEESGDAIRKKIVHEHRDVQRVMLDDPGNELRIGQNEPEQTEHHVEMPRFHACDLSACLDVCRAKVPRSSVCERPPREKRIALQFVDGDIAFSHCSKREDRQGRGRTWRRDQDQTARPGVGRKSQRRAALFSCRPIEYL